MRPNGLSIVCSILAISGCNAVFGIVSGEPAGGAGAAGGTGSSSSATGGTAGTLTTGGGGGGGGGVGGGCLPERPATCEPGTLDDSENCCVAGRSCQGGACASGECAPVQIAASPNPANEEVLYVVVVGDNVFWSSGYGSTLYRTSIDGGPFFTHATSNDSPETYLTRLATDGVYVYFTNYGTGRIARVPVAGGALEIVSEVPNAGTQPEAGFGQIAVGGGHVFWAMEHTGGVYHAALDGTLPAPAVVLQSGEAHGVATDDTYVYWGTASGSILKRPLADLSSGMEVVVSGQDTIRDVEVIGDRVYWLTYGAVRSAKKDGANQLVVTLYSGGDAPLGVAGDGKNVFFTLGGCESCNPQIFGYLYRVPVLGGTLVELARTTIPNDMRGIVMDCDTVYVANSADRVVMKATR